MPGRGRFTAKQDRMVEHIRTSCMNKYHDAGRCDSMAYGVVNKYKNKHKKPVKTIDLNTFDRNKTGG
jgi:hypothetical protein